MSLLVATQTLASSSQSARTMMVECFICGPQHVETRPIHIGTQSRAYRNMQVAAFPATVAARKTGNVYTTLPVTYMSLAPRTVYRRPPMRAEVEKLAESIRQSLALLRRHL